MIHSSVLIPEKIYKDIRKYLLPQKLYHEKVAFLFAKIEINQNNIHFTYSDWYPVRPSEYKSTSMYHIELIDAIRPLIIKKAFDTETTIVEIHSHPYKIPAVFSPSDLLGFHEFVPHIRWRLKGKPYGAIVLSLIDFDGLIWSGNTSNPDQLSELIIGEKSEVPNCRTMNRWDYYDYYSL